MRCYERGRYDCVGFSWVSLSVEGLRVTRVGTTRGRENHAKHGVSRPTLQRVKGRREGSQKRRILFGRNELHTKKGAPEDALYPSNLRMARDGVEPPTPRFSVACSTN